MANKTFGWVLSPIWFSENEELDTITLVDKLAEILLRIEHEGYRVIRQRQNEYRSRPLGEPHSLSDIPIAMAFLKAMPQIRDPIYAKRLSLFALMFPNNTEWQQAIKELAVSANDSLKSHERA